MFTGYQDILKGGVRGGTINKRELGIQRMRALNDAEAR